MCASMYAGIPISPDNSISSFRFQIGEEINAEVIVTKASRGWVTYDTLCAIQARDGKGGKVLLVEGTAMAKMPSR